MLGSVPSPHTIYRDIRALEPATTLAIDLDALRARPHPRRYWQAPKPSCEPLRAPARRGDGAGGAHETPCEATW